MVYNYSSRQALRVICAIRIRARQCAQRSGSTKFHTKICHQLTRNHDFRSYAEPWPCPDFFQWIFWTTSCVSKVAYGIGLAPQTTSTKTNWWISSYAQTIAPKIMNNVGPMLSHFARWFPKSRAKCKLTLRDKLYESLVQTEFVLDSARSATETPNFTPKCATTSLETTISAHILNLAPTQTFSNEFSGPPRVLPDLHVV